MAWGIDDINEAGALLSGIVEEHKTDPDERETVRDGASGTLAALEAVGFNSEEVASCATQMSYRFAREQSDPQTAIVTAYMGGLMVGAVLGKGESNGSE
jgi:hypothetical protein